MFGLFAKIKKIQTKPPTSGDGGGIQSQQLPSAFDVAAASPIVHVIGPGKLFVEKNLLVYRVVYDLPKSGQSTDEMKVPVHSIKQLFCYGKISLTADAIHAILENDIKVAFIQAGANRFLGSIETPCSEKSAFKIIQYSLFNDVLYSLKLAKQIIAGKISSQESAARHYQRHGISVAGQTIKKLHALAENAAAATDINQLRGFEGAASMLWFEIFAIMLKNGFVFSKRIRRPPTDPVNAMLSLGYTILSRRVQAVIEGYGFDPNIGFLHEYRPGRPSLVCDHVEPLRINVDRWVITMCNKGVVKPSDFTIRPNDKAVMLTEKAFPRVLANWEMAWIENKTADILHEQIRRFNIAINEGRRNLPNGGKLSKDG